MNKILITIIMLVSLISLSACSESNYSQIEEATIKDKIVKPVGLDYHYYILIEKGSNTVSLKVRKRMYEALTIGNTVDVTYDESFYVTDLKLPLMQEELLDKSK